MTKYLAAIVIAATLTGAAALASGEPVRPMNDAQFAEKVQEARGTVNAQVQQGKNQFGIAGQQGQSKVEITSFVFTGSRTRAAEICGKVTGADAPILVVRVTVDPKSDRPGAYNVLAGKDGLFCAVVATFTGTADASLAGQGTASASVAANAGESRN